MNNLKQKIKNLSAEYFHEIIEIRRHIHQYPELSNQEYKTSDFIASRLKKFGIPFEQGIFKTGIVGLIEGKNPDSKVVALRADIDALPVKEKNDIEYISKNKGIMHACGHDVHTSSLLGTAKILNKLKEYFEGTVKLIFQPAEEKIPGGAKFMIEEGVLENPKVDIIIGQHVYPDLEVGKIGMKSGKYMASTDEITLTVTGNGGHAAMPDLIINPLVIASQIIISMQQIISLNPNKNTPTVLSFGRFIANGTYNVIPHEVEIKGTFRAFDEKWRAKAHEQIKKTAKLIAENAGGTCEVFINKGYPFLINDDVITENAYKSAVEYLGEENVVDLDLRMSSEDFAYYSQIVPGCFYRLGTNNKTKGITSNLHTHDFNVDEKSLEIGMGLMAWIAVNELGA